jgi:hypothetical protein
VHIVGFMKSIFGGFSLKKVYFVGFNFHDLLTSIWLRFQP